MKVSFFITCLGDMFYPNAGKASVQLLEKFGCTVDFPTSQTCCGQPAFNSGYHQDAKKAAKQTITAFADSQYVVTPSGSCAAMLHEYPQLLQDEPEWSSDAELLTQKSYELTQFLVEVLGVENTGASFKAKATYHTSCHMIRLLGVTSAPQTLLDNVEGLEMIDLPNKHDCCGFGGTFAVKMPKISKEMVDEKVSCIQETEADILIGADAGCLMNIGGRLTRKNDAIKVMHIAEVLNHSE
ncbi:L-lactate dehydrogenase complex protein LldE [Geomicrobium halophilum]|uniref:Lactate utilization protein A n=1 Tax=Geomicrobium halophilum TaxID=549000 RepID=A0A841Q1S2_9BACL|nr:(Fe-S)-binding protein [Geomicrobium halophilum]MBB6449958.1 L-lactate dehydrogenase complex protein LldE [Geomicrobium halophilum]